MKRTWGFHKEKIDVPRLTLGARILSEFCKTDINLFVNNTITTYKGK